MPTHMTVKSKPAGPFACHSCMVAAVGPHLEFWDWGRDLCLTCAATVGAKLMALAGLGKARIQDEAPKPAPELFPGQ